MHIVFVFLILLLHLNKSVPQAIIVMNTVMRIMECVFIRRHTHSHVQTGTNPEQQDGYVERECFFVFKRQRSIELHIDTYNLSQVTYRYM
jgi:hypothetical protein